MYDQQRIVEAVSKQWLEYVEALFSAYTELFLVLSVIVLISIAWLCARELRVSSKQRRPNNKSYLSGYERMIEDHSSTC